MEWRGKCGYTMLISHDGFIFAPNGFTLTPTLARDIAKSLIEWANEQPIEGIIGKRYLTRDWQVVKYDGTQDVVARVYKKQKADRETNCYDIKGRIYWYDDRWLPSNMA